MLIKTLIHFVNDVKAVHNISSTFLFSKHFFKKPTSFSMNPLARRVAYLRQAHCLVTDAATLALCKLVTCCVRSHTVTAANWWQTHRIKHSEGCDPPHRGREVSLSLHSGARTGRGLATTSCDGTCAHALNIETLKKNVAFSCCFENCFTDWRQTKESVSGDNQFCSRSSYFIVM